MGDVTTAAMGCRMSEIPDARKMFLEVPPYAEFTVGPGQFVDVLKVQFFLGTLDAHCLECGKEGVFASASPPLRDANTPRTKGSAPAITVEDLRDPFRQAQWPYSFSRNTNPINPLNLNQMEPWALEDRTFDVVFSCTRDSTHRLTFFFRMRDRTFSKVGQTPSLADLQATDMAKYRKVLGDDRHREFTKAVGLHAHGVGIGAFVYLRRLFEWLIETAHALAVKDAGWDEGAYQRARMDEKILLLKGRLPAFMVENRSVYSILSFGIHELAEGQCLKYFEPVKTGIELILDEEIERRARVEKEERIRKALAAVKGELGGRK
ncbi:MAG TPA: hypothetical protein VD866_23170 [Urbifossiella sp.]|nr:hypothetical protein [Urbifossiella sp.]